MLNNVQDILKKIIIDNGRTIINDKKKIKAILTDMIPNSRLEINLISIALEQKIPSKICNSNMPHSILFSQLEKELENNFGIETNRAKWVIQTWAFALGNTTNRHDIINIEAKKNLPKLIMTSYEYPL